MLNLEIQEISYSEENQDDIDIKDKQIYDRLSSCLINYPYILINSKLLKEIIYEQSKRYNDNNMKKLCESLS